MVQVLVAWLALIVVYTFFRMHGGHGFTIQYKFPDGLTPEGRQDRMMSFIVLVLGGCAIAYSVVGTFDKGQIVSLLIALGVYSIFFQASRLRSRRRKK